MTAPRLFLVEQRLPRITHAELALLQATLAEACLRLTARGEAVRYLGSTYLPGPHRLLSLFEAATAEAVRTVSDSSQVPATSWRPLSSCHGRDAAPAAIASRADGEPPNREGGACVGPPSAWFRRTWQLK